MKKNVARIWLFILGLLAMAAPLAQGQPTYTYGDYVYGINLDGTVTLASYTGPGGAVTIPGSINGLLVTSLDSTFQYCSSLTSVTIPDSVTSMNDTFDHCTSLTSVTIPDSVTNLTYTFFNCTSLTSVTIPDSVTSLNRTFNDCVSLTSVTIPDSVTNLYDTFDGCEGLTSVTIPDSTRVTSLTFTFNDCWSLTSVTIPDSVTSLDSTFVGCNSLTSVTIPDSVTSLNDTFDDCSSLTNVTIPDSVTSLAYTFNNCTSLRNVCFEGDQPIDGGNIFALDPLWLVVLQYVQGTTGWGATFGGVNTAPCEQCGSAAAPGSDFVYTVNLDGTLTLTGYTGPGGAVTIPRTINGRLVTSLYGTFAFHTSLTSVTIPDSVTSLNRTFEDCTSLTSVTIPDGVTSLDYAFWYCTSLTSVTVPDSVTSLYQTFQGCASLTTVTIPDRVTSLPGTFYGCKSLTTVTIPDSVTSLDDTFMFCSSLASVTIPDTVTSLDYAFYYCASLTTVTIPDSVTSLDYAFFNSPSLRNVCFEGDQPIDGGYNFWGDPLLSVVRYVQGTTGWGATFGGVNTAPCEQCGTAGPPTAYAQLVTAAENTATALTLGGSDANSPPLPLTYTVTEEPAKGVLSGNPPKLAYTPDPCYTGPDSFQFIVNNGSQDSAPATVSITVVFARQAIGQAVAVSEDTATPVSLAGADAESLALTYEVTANPSQGTLSGTAPNLTYTPGTSYEGQDSFQFKVNNSFSDSFVATVSINVVGTGQNLVAAESVAAGERASVTVPPGSGQGGVTATLNNICGSQSVTITTQTYSGNPEPGTFGGVGTTYLDLKVSGATASDSMTSHFYYPSSVSDPTLRYYTGAAWEPVLSSGGQSPVVEQSPNLDGTVSGGRFTVVFDGTSTPTLAALSGTVFALGPAPPVPGAMGLGATENQSVSLPAAKLLAIATSPNGGALSITDLSATSAQGGTVTLGGGLVTYTPPAGFVGSDSFGYTLSDGVASAQGTVSVTVRGANEQSQNQLSIATSGSCAVVYFVGIPAVSYVVQWAPSATGPWTDFSPAIAAGTTGLFSYSDCTSPMPPSRFYRTRAGP